MSSPGKSIALTCIKILGIFWGFSGDFPGKVHVKYLQLADGS
jgi:hypothetical protein